MIDVAIMIEGQDGLNWPRWQRMARAVEDLGFSGLFRSDHYTNAKSPDKDALELWVSLTWLASNTRHIDFGPLVSPVSFRHPTHTARMATAVDDLSGGRLILGLGAGWQEREHHKFGWDLLPVAERFDRFQEGLEVITRLLESPQPVDFQGSYYQLREATLLPRPSREGGPPILVGGNGTKRTLPLVAHYADEWNGVYLTRDKFRRLNEHLDRLLEAEERPASAVRRSVMAGCEYGRTTAEVNRLVAQRTNGKRSVPELRSEGVLVGTAADIVEQLQALAQAGAQRVMLQWLAVDDLDRLQDMAEAVLPEVSPERKENR